MGIYLTAKDYLWATWRDYTSLPIPLIKPFNLTEALQRLSKLHFSWNTPWEKLKFPPRLSREEAHFWFMVMVSKESQGEWLSRRLQGHAFDGNLSYNDILAQLPERNLYYYPQQITVLLASLISPVEYIRLVHTIHLQAPNQQCYFYNRRYIHHAQRGLMNFVDGFRHYMWPYLTPQERSDIRIYLQQSISGLKYPADPTYLPAPVLYFAAMVGGMDAELLPLIEQLPDHYLSDKGPYCQHPAEIIFGLSGPKLVEHHIRRLQHWLITPEQVTGWLAHTELEALDWVFASIPHLPYKEDAEAIFKQAVKLAEDVTMTLPIFTLWQQASSVSRLALEWLNEHPDLAAQGLVPVALEQPTAREYLIGMQRKNQIEVLKSAFATLPSDQQAQLQTQMADSTASLPVLTEVPEWFSQHQPTRVSLPAWVDATLLPPFLLDGKQLSIEQMRIVLTALKSSTLEQPHALITALRQHLDAEKLDRFVWALFQLWISLDAPSKDKWAMVSLGLLGGDTTVLKLTPLIRKYPGESQHQRAVLGIECLRHIGTDTALMQINSIAQKVAFKGIKQVAQQAMEAIAKDRGLSREALADRIVPDCGLNARGQRTFDYGNRQFTFVLGEDLKPLVQDEKGKLNTNLPKPGAKDDPVLAERALSEWKLLKKQIREIASVQVFRLEQAMVTQRHWSVGEFEKLLVQHPLMITLIRTLVWGAYNADGDLQLAFRVTDEQDYADVDDNPVILDQTYQIGLIHPLYLEAQTCKQWGELMSSYELIASFPQLGRETYALTEAECEDNQITRFSMFKLHGAALVGTLEKQGWLRGAPQDAGLFYLHSKPFHKNNLTAVVEYDGMGMGYLTGLGEQTMKACYFLKGVYDFPLSPYNKEERLALKQIDPLILSEILRDLTLVASKARV